MAVRVLNEGRRSANPRCKCVRTNRRCVQILSESDGEADFEAVSDTIATDILDTSVTRNLDAGEYRLVVENAADLPEAA
ncbi:MAG: hypothetical protein ACI9PP_002345 [Halobacteriales archaeon]|jgi:hypothetical protein